MWHVHVARACGLMGDHDSHAISGFTSQAGGLEPIRRVRALAAPAPNAVCSVRWSLDSAEVATADDSGAVRVWAVSGMVQSLAGLAVQRNTSFRAQVPSTWLPSYRRPRPPYFGPPQFHLLPPSLAPCSTPPSLPQHVLTHAHRAGGAPHIHAHTACTLHACCRWGSSKRKRSSPRRGATQTTWEVRQLSRLPRRQRRRQVQRWKPRGQPRRPSGGRASTRRCRRRYHLAWPPSAHALACLRLSTCLPTSCPHTSLRAMPSRWPRDGPEMASRWPRADSRWPHTCPPAFLLPDHLATFYRHRRARPWASHL